jgi:hypothetical protein
VSTKADYTPEEWAQLTQAPIMAATAIVASDTSGPIGLVKEASAIVKAVQETAQSATAGELVKAISVEIIESQNKEKGDKQTQPTDQQTQPAQPADPTATVPTEGQPAQPAESQAATPNPLAGAQIKATSREDAMKQAVDHCVAAAAIVTQKSPAEADEFKNWLMSIANKTAEAAKEGGFLGFGGTLVSDKEKSELANLAAALGVSAS